MFEKKYNLLKKYYGYDSYRQGQEYIIDAVLSGRDVLGVMPTGAGKSVCFQVPSLLYDGVTVVVSPLISLMKDQVQALNEKGINAVCLNSSVSFREQKLSVRRILRGKVKLVYVAPERLTNRFFRSVCRRINVSVVAVDEAHCVSQWGRDFRPSYLRIKDFISFLPRRPVVCALTATATPEVREDIIRLIGLENPATLVTGFDRPNLYFGVIRTEDKYKTLIECLDFYKDKCGIVYCSSRRAADRLHALLLKSKITSVKYHAGMTKRERIESQELFISGRKKLVIATNAFGLGIDKPDIRFVIHYTVPGDLESYYQEAGRAGRDKKAADCILIYSTEDIKIQKYFINNSDADSILSPDERALLRRKRLKRLGEMVAYCESKGCLREHILSYFGEEAGRCGNCSGCRLKASEADGNISYDTSELFETLVQLREKASFDKELYTGDIISDALLSSFAEHRPLSLYEMKKLCHTMDMNEEYSALFLKEINKFQKEKEDGKYCKKVK